MKIVLVRPNVNIRWMITPPIGMGYVLAAMKRARHEAIINDSWMRDESPARATMNMLGNAPDIIGIQLFSDGVPWAREFIKIVRQHTSARIIVGGPYVTAIGEQARIETGADTAVIGEFETDIDDHLHMILSGETLIKRAEWVDVNTNPIPDWDSMLLPKYWPYLFNASVPVRGKRVGVIQRTRGCPFHCTFCSGGTNMGHKVRFRDTDNVIEEIKYLRKRWNIDEVWFQDDNAIVNYRRGIELFNKLAPLKLHIRFPSGIRWENVTNEMARMMKQAGVYFTGIGIESGNPRVLKRIKKQLDQEWTRDAIKILARHGILTIGFFIIGLPTETRDEMEDTVRWAMNTRLHHAQFGRFIPYPGSEDYSEHSLLTNNEIIKVQRNATLRFYLRPRIIWHLMKHMKLSQMKAIFNHPWVKSWTSRENKNNHNKKILVKLR